MSCVDARDALSALIDEALAPGERAAVEAHVGGCPDCQRELEGLRATVALLRGMERPRAPAGFVDRVVAAARPEPWRRRLGRWLFFPLGVKLPMEAAAVALVAVVAVYVVHRSPELREVGREAMAPASPPAAPAEAPREGRTRSVDAVRPTSPPSPGRPDRATPPSREAPTSQSGPIDKERLDARIKDARTKTEARDAAGGVGGMATGETPARPADEASDGDRLSASGDVRRGVGGAGSAATGSVTTSGGPTGGGPPASTATPPTPGPPTAAAPPPASGSPAAPATQAGNVAEPDAREEKTLKSASPLAARQAAKVAPGPDVSGRLAVSTPEAAERALDLLVDRLGGRRIARRPDPAAPGRVLVELEVPREALGELATGLGRIGHWVPERAPAGLPAPTGLPAVIRVEVSVGD